MGSNGEGSGLLIAWSIGGFVLAVVALFVIFGGQVLSLVMVAATPVILGFLLVEAIFGKRPVYIASWRTSEETHLPLREQSRERRVSMQVTRGKGVCHKGYTFNPGCTWTLNGELEGPSPLCPEAYRVLHEYAKHTNPLDAEAREMTLLCANGHVIGLGLRPADMGTMPRDNPSPTLA